MNAQKTGHGGLLWGALLVVAGYAVSFVAISGAPGFAAIGLMVIAGGAITWAIGMGMRIAYNRSAESPILFTTGEKVGVLGAISLVLAVFASIVSGGEAEMMSQVFAVGGVALSSLGVIWHLMSPRHAVERDMSSR